MTRARSSTVCVFVFTVLTHSPVVQAVSIGQVDTFTSSTLGWIAPDPTNPNPPTTALGGPGGALDAFLRLESNGNALQAGSRMVALNQSQWTGDYLAAGINAISMDVNNFGPATLSLRLLFESFQGPPPPTHLALSTNPVVVPAGSGWTKITFPITPGDLTALFGTAAGALADTTTLRIFHNPQPQFGGPNNGPPALVDVLGVDNITATTVPEESVYLMIGTGLILFKFLSLHHSKNR